MFKISACDVPLAVVIACHCGNEFQILEIRNRWTKNAGNRKTQNGYRKTEKMLKILQFHFEILPHTYIHISVRFRIRFYKVSSDKNGPSLLQHVVIVPDPPFSVQQLKIRKQKRCTLCHSNCRFNSEDGSRRSTTTSYRTLERSVISGQSVFGGFIMVFL